MTTHDDRIDLEARLRASLQQRADDVEVTPALYERVQRQASRGAWLRRGLALAGAAAMVVAVVVVVPSLLPEPDIDIADTPEDAQPTDAPTDDGPTPDTSPADGVVDPLMSADVAFADGALVNVRQRAVTSPAPVRSLAVSPLWTEDDGAVAAGLEDGRIGVLGPDPAGGDRFDLLVEAAANGSGVGFSPDGQAIAWIEGTDLHILPLSSAPEGERVSPLVGDVPGDLVLEQWFGGADAQLVLASDPRGGVWRIPMDDSDAFNSEPTDPASLLPGADDSDVVDAALLADRSLAVLRVPADGSGPTVTLGGLPVAVDEVVDAGSELAVTGSSLTLFDPTTGTGSRRDVDTDSYDLVATWEVPGITAVAPLPIDGSRSLEGTGGQAGGTGTADELGLPTDSPVIGTTGTELVVRGPDGVEQRLEVYPAESEASLGRLAVRPGSTLDDGLVAVESSSEGETSVRFVALRGGAASPIGDVQVTDGPVTGVVWSEDGTHVAWTDAGGFLTAGEVSDAGRLSDGGQLLLDDAAPVVDWVWTGTTTDGDVSGHFTMAVAGGTDVELLSVVRAPDGSLGLTGGSAGGSDGVVLDTHASPGADVGPAVRALLGGGTAELRWDADGGRVGGLADPGQLGGDVRVQVSGGHVLAMGDSRQVLVTFDGEVVDLPPAADWDVLD